MKKILLLTLAVIFLTASCATAKQTAEVQTKPAETPVENIGIDENSTHPLKISDAYYEEMMGTSLVSKGNNFRLKKVLEKLKAGEKVYVACIGGSVTDGAGPAIYTQGYAYQFKKKLSEKFTPNNGENIVFDGAGLSGTPSTLGRLRYESDVVEVLGHTPDILIVEFAVNDSGSALFSRSFEAIVRHALLESEDTAVIALYAAATYGTQQVNMTKVSSYYKIPEVSVSDAIKKPLAEGVFKKGKYYSDSVHPKKDGHEIMADCLMNLLTVTDSTPYDEKFEVPQDHYNRKPLTDMIRIYGDDKNVKITAGSFSKTDSNCQSVLKTQKSNFPQNWYKPASAENEEFVMNIKCRSLQFVYKEQGAWLSEKFGKAEVIVDDRKPIVFDGGKAGGWNNCVTQFLIDEEEPSEHTVVVRMAEGSENLGFTIVAMSYTE